MTFPFATSKDFINTFKLDIRFAPGLSYLAAQSASAIYLVDTVGACSIVAEFRFDMTTSLIAWHSLKRVDWEDVSSISIFQLLSFAMKTGTVFLFSKRGSASDVKHAKNVLNPESCINEVPFLRPVLSESLVRRGANEYMFRWYSMPIPTQIFDFRVPIL